MEVKLEIVDIPHGAIRPNPENPNRMENSVLKALKEDIETRGNVQPILVRPLKLAGEVPMHVADCPMTKYDPKDRYTCTCQHYGDEPKLTPEGGVTHEIVDGEHRWRVLGELGAETVPCVVEDLSREDQQIRMITMNRLRGQFVPIKLAHLLADLATRNDLAQMRTRLAMEQSEMKDLLDLGDYMEPPPPKVDSPEPPSPRPGRDVVVVATPEQAERIETLTSEDIDEQIEKISAALEDVTES